MGRRFRSTVAGLGLAALLIAGGAVVIREDKEHLRDIAESLISQYIPMDWGCDGDGLVNAELTRPGQSRTFMTGVSVTASSTETQTLVADLNLPAGMGFVATGTGPVVHYKPKVEQTKRGILVSIVPVTETGHASSMFISRSKNVPQRFKDGQEATIWTDRAEVHISVGKDSVKVSAHCGSKEQ